MKKYPKTHTPAQNNQGIVLIVSLIFLLLSTLIGVSTLRNNLFNEKMTQNTIQRKIALEIAEATLLEGEQFVIDNTDNIINAVFTGERDPAVGEQITALAQKCQALIDGEGGICGTMELSFSDPEKHYENWVDVTDTSKRSLNVWSTPARYRKASDEIKNEYSTNSPAQFIVEFMGYDTGTNGVSACQGTASHTIELTSWPYCSLDNPQFRITALARAGNYDEIQIMLQSTFITN